VVWGTPSSWEVGEYPGGPFTLRRLELKKGENLVVTVVVILPKPYSKGDNANLLSLKRRGSIARKPGETGTLLWARRQFT